MRIASVDARPDPGYLVLICTHIIINYLSINVILSGTDLGIVTSGLGDGDVLRVPV